DLSPSHLLHQLQPVRRRSHRRTLDAKPREQCIEPRTRGRIAHAEGAFELLHVSARREEHPEHVEVLVGEDAELARRECARELGLTGGACEARHSKARAADRAIHRRPAGCGARHQTTSSRTLPIMQSMFRTPAPDPTALSLTPFVSTSPILVCALMRTLDVRSRRTLTSPIWQRMELSPPSRRPVASMLPAATDSFTGPANPLTTQLPAWT